MGGKKSPDSQPEKKSKKADDKSSTKIVKKSFVSGSSDNFTTQSLGGGPKSKTSLTQSILGYAEESQESNPTVLVWLFDESQSASKLRERIVSEIKDFAKTAKDELAVETAIVGFSKGQIQPHTADPAKKPDELLAALDKIGKIESEGVGTFSAIHAALGKYEYLRKTARKTVILVLVTDQAGDDADKELDGRPALDQVISKLDSLSIPLFAIGNASPFGRGTDLVDGKNKSISYGPETVFAERINLGMWNGSTDIFRYDSGFGPWNLEKACRDSGGRFLADRPAQKSMRLVSKMQSNWPAVTSRQFKDSVMSSYKPYYGSVEAYLADVNSSKAKKALHTAAKLKFTKVFRIQDYEFRQTNEAAMARQINMTQRTPAIIRPGLEKLYDILKAGEADRDELKSKRWQASFDLAYGRTMANYVRVIGLNSMLAELKGGKAFSKPENNSWILMPDVMITTGTSNKKMADKAKLYLQRVIDEHPETPWAMIAKKELESPMGWKWMETSR